MEATLPGTYSEPTRWRVSDVEIPTAAQRCDG